MLKEEEIQSSNTSKDERPICGIVMPISEINGCTAEHWKEVKTILSEAINTAGYSANLVSEANDSSVIQNRIIKNLYKNKIVICDVSCKNPNVMFELGIRLAFDKPTIIVMDDNTDYVFDVNIIEHLKYPRDLSYYKILDFKKKLSEKIIGTIEESKKPDYTTFLKHFGDFTAAKIDNKEIPMNDALVPYFEDISTKLAMVIRSQQNFNIPFLQNEKEESINIIIRRGIDSFVKEFGYSLSAIYNNENGEKQKLQKYLERHHELCRLCQNPNRMLDAINYNLSMLLL